MTLRTVERTDYDSYLEYMYPGASAETADERDADIEQRRVRLAAFPFAVILKVAYPEIDFANRWCWQQFGLPHGECHQRYSEYPACDSRDPHSHLGTWMTSWLVKTDYDFGFNEWYFQQQADQNRFLEFAPQINWGEHYPKR